MKRCNNCGSLIDDDTKFCMYCGTKVTEEKKEEEYISDEGEREYTVCPHCQAYMDKYDRFCPRCGIENEKYSGEAKNYYNSFSQNVTYTENKPKNPIECYKGFWKRAFDFKGRSTRSEYWWPYLFNFIITDIISSIIGLIPQKEVVLMDMSELGVEGFTYGVISLIFTILIDLILIIPSLASEVRRLRDTGKSPFVIFMGLIPFAGPFILIYYLAQKTDRYKY